MKNAGSKPKIMGGIPADRALYQKCRTYLARGVDPEDPEFVRQLMRAYVEGVKFMRLTGPEIAAMVDDRAKKVPTIRYAIELVHSRLNKTFSIDSITKHHNRYGKSAKALADERKKVRDFYDEYFSVTADEWAASEKTAHDIHERYENYLKAKKDIFG